MTSKMKIFEILPQYVSQKKKTLVFWVKSPKIFSTVVKFVGSEVDGRETLVYLDNQEG